MKISVDFDFDQVRVVSTVNSKGNPRVYLEILGVPVLYSDPYTLADNNPGYFGSYVTVPERTNERPYPSLQPDDVDAEGLEDLFRHRLAFILRGLLEADMPELAQAWSHHSDREMRGGTPSRIEVKEEW